jgi:SAM-dependent methyltransferase
VAGPPVPAEVEAWQQRSGWRIFLALIALRSRLAPPGTRRDRVARRGLSGLADLAEHVSGNSIGARSAASPPAVAELALLEVRARIAERWLRGEGLEIGALHVPLRIPPWVTVQYVDRLPLEGLRREYPELADKELVAPSVIDDGQTLATVADESVDFVIANHMLEHCEDPIGALRTFLRVVRPGGVVFFAVPDKRRTFDHKRPLTPLEHLVRDYEEGPAWSRRAHFEEWAELVDHPEPTTADHWMDRDANIHFHVWTPIAFLEVLSYCADALPFPFDVACFEQNEYEFVVVLTRLAREDAETGVDGAQESLRERAS